MLKVAQILKDTLYQNLSLEDTGAYDDPLSERAVQESPVQSSAVELCPSFSSEVASLLTVIQHPCHYAVTQISETLVLHKCFWG